MLSGEQSNNSAIAFWDNQMVSSFTTALMETSSSLDVPSPSCNFETLAPQGLYSNPSVDSLDWKDLSASEITKRVISKVQAGSIVLFHNAAKHTPEALPGIIETLLQDGHTLVPISQIILDGEYGTDYTIDHAGKQCPVSP